jgi:hypothetical protein
MKIYNVDHDSETLEDMTAKELALFTGKYRTSYDGKYTYWIDGFAVAKEKYETYLDFLRLKGIEIEIIK